MLLSTDKTAVKNLFLLKLTTVFVVGFYNKFMPFGVFVVYADSIAAGTVLVGFASEQTKLR